MRNRVPNKLQQLAAPIALYPDSLVAQILPAATYPDQVVEAEKWMEQHKDLRGDQLAKEVDKQSWDSSVKALTQFPTVLANMNQNLAWTSELGDVYANQQQDLTQAIQTMRQRAKGRRDIRKLKAHGLVERDGKRYAFRLTPKGNRAALMFVLFHKRVCGPLANSLFNSPPRPEPNPATKLQAAYRKADQSIQQILQLLAA